MVFFLNRLPSMPLKIAQVAAADLSIRVLLLDQIQALQQMGHEVVAVCAQGEWVERIRELGVPVHTVGMVRELSPVADAKCLFELRDLFRSERFDVVHTHTPKAGLLGPMAAQWAGVPVVVHTIHGLLFHDRMSALRRIAGWMPEKLTAMFADRLLSQSREDISVAIRSGLCEREKIAYIGNGIDVGRFSGRDPQIRLRARRELGIAEDAFVVGSVGRLVYEKGFDELFAAAAELIPRHPGLKFVIIGPRDAAQNDAIPQSHIDRVRQTGALRLLPWQDDMRKCYSAMDVFAMPSYREGIPRACMEAAAMGLPVIASDIRGCREVVLHGDTGLLVRVRDSAGLAQAIEQLMTQPELCRALGARAANHIRQGFSNALVLNRLREFYSGIEVTLGRKAVCA